MSKVDLFDHGVGPNLLHQLVLVHHPAVSDQHQQRLEDLRLERDRFPLSQQHPPNGVQVECVELVTRFVFLAYRPHSSSPKKVKENLSRRKRLSRAIRAKVCRVVSRARDLDALKS